MAIAVTNQMVLILHTLFVWVAAQEQNHPQKDRDWFWPSFVFAYEFFAEIGPFLFFAYILFKQVMHFKKVYDRNQGMTVISHSANEDRPLDADG